MCLMYLMYNTYLNYKQVEIYIHNKSVFRKFRIHNPT